jgi:hypothetical protein
VHNFETRNPTLVKVPNKPKIMNITQPQALHTRNGENTTNPNTKNTTQATKNRRKKKQLKCEGIKPYHVLEMITVVDKHQILHIQAP